MLAERTGNLVLTYFLCTIQSLTDDHTFLLHKEYSEFTGIPSNYHANLQLLCNMQTQREAGGLFHAESPICIILCTTSDLLKQFLISNGA
jgi:hypothetical protein